MHGLVQLIESTLSVINDSALSPKSDRWASIIGIVVAICGNVLISFALNIQRYAHIRLNDARNEDALEEQDGEHTGDNALHSEDLGNGERRPLIGRRKSEEEQVHDSTTSDTSYISSPWWLLGVLLMFLGEGGNFIAYGFAPASIISPLGVVALVSNCLLAPWFLHERFRWRDGVGVLIAIVGCVTVVLSANSSNPKLNADKIWKLATTWEFETYVAITLTLIVIITYVAGKYGERTVLLDLGLLGLYGAYTALSIKGISSLLSNSLWKIITFPITYALVAIMALSAIMQLKYLNRALQKFEATQVIPTQFVMFTISVIIGSAVLYRDFERLTRKQLLIFFIGCALTFFGVYCVTAGRKEGDTEEYVDHEAESGLTTESTTAGLALTMGNLDEDQDANGPMNRPPWRTAISEQLLPQVISNPRKQITSGRSVSYQPAPSLRSVGSQNYSTLPSRAGSSISPHARSFSRLLSHPGPLTTLSSSLSGIVADELRKGINFDPQKRRISFRSRKSQQFVRPSTSTHADSHVGSLTSNMHSRTVSQQLQVVPER